MFCSPCRRLWPAFPFLSRLGAGWALLATLTLAGCTGSHAIARYDGLKFPGLTWFAPVGASDRTTLARWSAGVGPPVLRNGRTGEPQPSDTLSVISWNTALGAGDITALLRDVRSRNAGAHIVLLLQEVYRGGPEVPAAARNGMQFAGKLGGHDLHRREVESIAEAEGLNVYYVPSMRNGSPLESNEDRGNAILSTLPLTDLSAIELPFERQRRVAVAATVAGQTSDGRPWQVRVVSSHFDNVVGPRRGWIFGGELARIRQARALVDYLGADECVVLGGDLNTWSGFEEGAYKEIAREFPDTHVRDRRATFMGLLRLDHLFFRLPDGWRGEFHRGAKRYGSDHYPLIATISLRDRPAAASAGMKAGAPQ